MCSRVHALVCVCVCVWVTMSQLRQKQQRTEQSGDPDRLGAVMGSDSELHMGVNGSDSDARESDSWRSDQTVAALDPDGDDIGEGEYATLAEMLAAEPVAMEEQEAELVTLNRSV